MFQYVLFRSGAGVRIGIDIGIVIVVDPDPDPLRLDRQVLRNDVVPVAHAVQLVQGE